MKVAWIEPSGYEIRYAGNFRRWIFYPQPPLGMKFKEGPELNEMLKYGAKQVIQEVEAVTAERQPLPKEAK